MNASGFVISINPFDFSEIEQHEYDKPNLIKIKIEQSIKAGVINKSKKISDRIECLKQIALQLENRKSTIAQLISLEMGKILIESLTEVEKCISLCNYYVKNAETFLDDRYIDVSESDRKYVIYQPLGVVLGIMPWNFPLWQVFRFAVPAFISGNSILLKHAENVWCVAKEIEKIWSEVGDNSFVFQCVFCNHLDIESIIESKDISAVTLTGSEVAGREVAKLAGQYLKKVTLELGGNDVFVVNEDVDIELAAKQAAKSRMINNGQSCIAAKRLLVSKHTYQNFVDCYLSEIENYQMGNPLDKLTTLGPLARADLKQKLIRQVKQSLGSDTRLLGSSIVNEDDSNFFSPLLLENVKPNSPAYREELFGPVASIFQFDSVEQAIFIANDSRFGLGASVWTNDVELQNRYIQELEVGAVFVNHFVYSSPDLPFGGIKDSGIGRELAKEGIMEFVNTKSIYINNKTKK